MSLPSSPNGIRFVPENTSKGIHSFEFRISYDYLQSRMGIFTSIQMVSFIASKSLNNVGLHRVTILGGIENLIWNRKVDTRQEVDRRRGSEYVNLLESLQSWNDTGIPISVDQLDHFRCFGIVENAQL